jgi:hypothetical protein
VQSACMREGARFSAAQGKRGVAPDQASDHPLQTPLTASS